ncbi:hypothetical protein V6N13_050855 [Hibiscus sabdariffa]
MLTNAEAEEKQFTPPGSKVGTLIGGVAGGVASCAIVVALVVFVKKKQHNDENPGGVDVAENKANDAYDTHTATISIDEEMANKEVDSNRMSPVFSMLVDAKGR